MELIDIYILLFQEIDFFSINFGSNIIVPSDERVAFGMDVSHDLI